jgi:hypothetical protein
MIDGFEERLADLIADRLAAVTELQLVTRPRANLPALAADRGRVVAAVLQGAPVADLADPPRELFRTGSTLATRPLLRLTGTAALAVETQDGGAGPGARPLLFRLMDQLLLTMADPQVREGAAFVADEDLGFALERFELTEVKFEEATEGLRRAVARYAYTGRFWPVEPAQAAGAIRALPVRMAVLPAGLPDQLRVRAGGDPLRIPVVLDLRALQVGEAAGAADPRLVARLMGASAPGALEGGQAGEAPPGATIYAPDAAGGFTIVYRPPAAVAGRVRARVGLGLAHGAHPTIAVGVLAIEVGP